MNINSKMPAFSCLSFSKIALLGKIEQFPKQLEPIKSGHNEANNRLGGLKTRGNSHLMSSKLSR